MGGADGRKGQIYYFHVPIYFNGNDDFTHFVAYLSIYVSRQKNKTFLLFLKYFLSSTF